MSIKSITELNELRNDEDVQQYATLAYRPETLDETYKWFDRITTDENIVAYEVRELHSLQFSINVFAGYITLSGISWRNGSAQLGICLSKNHRRQGIGTKAIQLLLHHAFCKIELSTVVLTVFSDNKGAHVFYTKLGFLTIGSYTKLIYRTSKVRADAILMQILREDFVCRINE